MNACVNLDLIEGQISSCKATQTDWDIPESAGKKTKLLPAMRFFLNLLSSERRLTANPHDTILAPKYRLLLAMSEDAWKLMVV